MSKPGRSSEAVRSLIGEERSKLRRDRGLDRRTDEWLNKHDPARSKKAGRIR